MDKELLACYFAIKKCGIYVLGFEFIVYTDHKPVINLKGFKDVVNRRYRWIEHLEIMSVRLRYLPGAENIVADCGICHGLCMGLVCVDFVYGLCM